MDCWNCLVNVCVSAEVGASSDAGGRYGDGGADCFVPGAISNRTLEHLMESNARPQQYRAIRGEQQLLQSYTSSQYVLSVIGVM